MISPERMILTAHDDRLSSIDQIQLAPFTANEYRQYIPYPEEYIRHNLISPDQDKLTPEEIIELHNKKNHSLTWGVYVKDQKANSSADVNFVGTVGISEYNTGTEDKPHWSRVLQEVHTSIYSDRFHGRGIGTLAKLAVASYAFDRQGTHALQASTSASNIAAHRSLKKTGFSHLDTYEHYAFQDGSMTAYWMLADPKAQAARRDPKEREILAEGWNRYQAAQRTVTIDHKQA